MSGRDPAAKVAVITGAYGGIGQAVALRLAADGCTAICADIQGADETCRRIASLGHAAESAVLDVRSAESWKTLVDTAVARHGTVDFLANVAGVVNTLGPDTVVDLTEEGWDFVLDVDLKGVWLGMRASLPPMIRRGHGRIVNISSLAAKRGLSGLASYSAAKGGVEALTRQAAVEYGPRGILINAIAPGYISTPINARSETRKAELAGRSPLGRAGEPSEIASVVAYLFREASFVTGQVIAVDGGRSTNV